MNSKGMHIIDQDNKKHEGDEKTTEEDDAQK
jgi:hypothetical protein